MALAINEELIPLWKDFQYKAHQIEGIRWMIQRETVPAAAAGEDAPSKPRGGLLCDEMGLGKTMETLGLIKNTPAIRNTLLLGPKAVLEQWRVAAIRSRINVCVLDGNKWSRPSPFFLDSKQTLYISNYEKVLVRYKAFSSIPWDRIVLDEAHRIRNGGSVLTQALFKLKEGSSSAAACIGWPVTATPIVNGLSDIKTLFQFVGYPKHLCSSFEQCTQLTEEAVLYRSMEEMRPILTELPALPTVSRIELDFHTEEEQEFYQGIQGALVRRWKANEADGGNMKLKLLLLMRLRQISVHPQVYISSMKKSYAGYRRDDWSSDSTKFVALRKQIESATLGARWIVFCQFHEEIDLLQAYLEKSPVIQKVYTYDGRMSSEQKNITIESTKSPFTPTEGKHEVLLLQLHSGGVGLNLQHFTKVIFLSAWWTAALMEQAVGRAVRIGQTEVVEVSHLVLKEESTLNIDAYMAQRADAKKLIATSILSYANAGKEFLDEVEGAEAEEDPIAVDIAAI
jgi:SNF2 family DNA or RNA helicase